MKGNDPHFIAARWCPADKRQTSRDRAVYPSIESRHYGPVAAGIWCASWEIGCGALGIRGHFAVLPEADRGAGVPGPTPGYDVSRVADEPL